MMKLGGARIMQQGCISSAGTVAVVKTEAIKQYFVIQLTNDFFVGNRADFGGL